MQGLIGQSGRQFAAELLQHLQLASQAVIGGAESHQAQPRTQQRQVAIWIEADKAQISP